MTATGLDSWREAADRYCMSHSEAAQLLSSAPWQRLCIMGDSVAAGVGEPLEGYGDANAGERVAEVLRVSHPGLAYVNLGERDLRLDQIRERQLAPALAFGPDLVVVAAGGNDALSRGFDEDRCAHELTLLAAPLVEAGALLVTIGLFDLARSGLVPEPYASPMAQRFDRLDLLTRRVALEHGGVHIDNHHHPLAADAGIYASDRIHGNARGHAIGATNLIKGLAAHLSERAVRSPDLSAASPQRTRDWPV